jgi:putative membrane protein
MRISTLTLAIALALGTTAALAQPDTTNSTDQSTGTRGAMPPGGTQVGTGATRAATETTSGTDTSSSRSDRDEKMANITSAKFVEKAARQGMTEVEASKLALQKSNNEDVKSFANHMIKDHTQANNDLTSIASSKNLTVPTDPDLLHKAAIKRLSSKSGAEFDRAYAQQMSKDHDKTVALFRSASSASAVDPELQAFAKKTLPTLEHHDQLAMQLNTSVDKGAAASTGADR